MGSEKAGRFCTIALFDSDCTLVAIVAALGHHLLHGHVDVFKVSSYIISTNIQKTRRNQSLMQYQRSRKHCESMKHV